MKKFFLFLSISFAFFLNSNELVGQKTELWNELVITSVSDKGEVDYAKLKMKRNELDDFLHSLSVSTPSENWSKQKKTAFWVNAYNAFTIQLILDHYPVASIMQINNGKAWDLKFIEIGGISYSLNNIEHDILRKKYFDPRLHFILNCAAQSCPRLYNRAFTEENIELIMDKLSKEFINDSDENSLQMDPITISQLFNWYQEDFIKKGSLIDFLNQYSNQQVNSNARIEFKEYNWNLNSVTH